MKTIEEKKCTKCGVVFPLTTEYFYRDSYAKIGFSAHCRSCMAIYIKEYNNKNKEKIKEQRKEYYSKNREKLIEYTKEYASKNREKRKEYRSKNKEKINEYARKLVYNLHDCYIAGGLLKMRVKDVPKEVLELKRIIIKLRRELK